MIFNQNNITSLSKFKKLILGLLFSILIVFIFNNTVQASSSTAMNMSEEEFWIILKNNGYIIEENLTLDNFTYNGTTVSRFKNNLNSSSNRKYFTSYVNQVESKSENKLTVKLIPEDLKFILGGDAYRNVYYYYASRVDYEYIIDLNEKTITNTLNTVGFNFSATDGSVTVDEFCSYAYAKKIFYDLFFYNAGTATYVDTLFSSSDNNKILNDSVSYKINSYVSGDTTITGNLTYNYNDNLFYLNITSDNLPVGNYSCFLTYYRIFENSSYPTVDNDFITYTSPVYIFNYDGLNSSCSIPISPDMITNLKSDYPFESDEYTGLRIFFWDNEWSKS